MPGEGPLPDRSHVHMNELTLWIVADATRSKRERRVSHEHSGDTGYTDVDRPSLDMLGVFCSVRRSAFAQHIVGLLRPVAGEDVDCAVWFTKLRKHGVEHIERTRIVPVYLLVVAVSQEVAELVDGFGDVDIAYAVDHIDHFVRVGMREFHLVLLAFGRVIVFVYGQQPFAGKSGVHKSMGHGPEPGVRMGSRFAGAGRTYPYAEQSGHQENKKVTERDRLPKRHLQMLWQSGRTPSLGSQR